jgi:hypothetical protein
MEVLFNLSVHKEFCFGRLLLAPWRAISPHLDDMHFKINVVGICVRQSILHSLYCLVVLRKLLYGIFTVLCHTTALFVWASAFAAFGV